MGDEIGDLRFIQNPITSDARAYIHGERLNLSDSRRHVAGHQPARQEHRHANTIADLAAYLPIVSASRSPKFSHWQRRIPRIQKKRVHLGGNRFRVCQ